MAVDQGREVLVREDALDDAQAVRLGHGSLEPVAHDLGAIGLNRCGCGAAVVLVELGEQRGAIQEREAVVDDREHGCLGVAEGGAGTIAPGPAGKHFCHDGLGAGSCALAKELVARDEALEVTRRVIAGVVLDVTPGSTATELVVFEPCGELGRVLGARRQAVKLGQHARVRGALQLAQDPLVEAAPVGQVLHELVLGVVVLRVKQLFDDSSQRRLVKRARTAAALHPFIERCLLLGREVRVARKVAREIVGVRIVELFERLGVAGVLQAGQQPRGKAVLVCQDGVGDCRAVGIADVARAVVLVVDEAVLAGHQLDEQPVGE